MFVGREEETDDLVALLITEGVVLFHAVSGAGKSSLVNAALIPALKARGHDVLPVVRVGSDLPAEVAARGDVNPFVFNAISQLGGSDRPPESIVGEELSTFLARTEDVQADRGRVLVFDQFEEILTTHLARYRQRDAFVVQLGAAIQSDKMLSVLFVAREDHAPRLLEFADLLPDRRLGRLRIDQLTRDDALRAVTEPALKAGRPFDANVAERLVDDLARGEYVEPIILQVVCYQLWEELTEHNPSAVTITNDHIKNHGNPDLALRRFYDGAVRRVASANKGVSEILIRRWIETRLITSRGIRAQVVREPFRTGGLPNGVVDSLVDEHILRKEPARNAVWYELVHDRFIDPILTSNATTLSVRERQFRVDARRWENRGRQDEHLYHGKRLKAASAWVQSSPDSFGDVEREFLAQSERAEADYSVKIRRLTIALGVFMAAFALLALWIAAGAWEKQQAALSGKRALAALNQLTADPERSLLTALAGALTTYAAKGFIYKEEKETLNLALHASRLKLVVSAGDEMRGVAFARDGQSFAVQSVDGVVRIIETFTGREMRKWTAEPRKTTAAFGPAFALGDKRIATTGDSGAVAIWDTASGAHLGTVSPGLGPIHSIAFSPDESLLAIAGARGVRICTTETRDCALRSLLDESSGPVHAVAFGPTGKELVAGGEAGTIFVWNTDTLSKNTAPRSMTSVGNEILSLAFDPKDKDRIAAAIADGKVYLWKIGDPEAQALSYQTNERVNAVAFCPRGDCVVTAGSDGTIRRRALAIAGTRPNDVQAESTLNGHADEIVSLAFSPAGDRLVSASRDRTARLWDATLSAPPFPGEPAALSKDGQTLAMLSRDRVTLWDTSGRRVRGSDVLGPLDQNAQACEMCLGASFSGDGRRLAVYGTQGISIWSVDTLTQLKRIPNTSPYVAAALTEEGNRIAVAEVNDVRVWEVDQLGELFPKSSPDWEAKKHRLPIRAVGLDGRGTYLATGSEDGVVNVWALATRTHFEQLNSRYAVEMLTIGVTPDLSSRDKGGARIASATADGAVWVWDLLPTGKPRSRLLGEFSLLVPDGIGARSPGARRATTAIHDMVFADDGLLLAVAGRSGARVWNLSTMKEIFALPGHSFPTRKLALSADGHRLITAGPDGSIYNWPLQDDDLLALARDAVSRGLTATECDAYFDDPRCSGPARALDPYVQGRDLSRAGNLAEGERHLDAAKSLDPGLRRSAAEMARGFRARALIDAAISQMRLDRVPEAADLFRAAQLVDGTKLPLSFATELVARGEELAKRSSAGVMQALQVYKVAEELNSAVFRPERRAGALSLNNLCWFGTLNGRAAEVMSTCDRAVTLWAENKNVQDSRGLAKACAGDLEGAATDFSAFVQWTLSNEERKERNSWIQKLRSGRNPCTPALRAKLLAQ